MKSRLQDSLWCSHIETRCNSCISTTRCKKVASRKWSPLVQGDLSFTSMNHNFTFINLPTQSSRRDREIARSQANAHVARFGHRRRGLSHQSHVVDGRPARPITSRSFSEERPSLSRSSPTLTVVPSLELAVSASTPDSLRYSASESPTSSWVTSDHVDFNPWHIINSGNSDPFACMPIPITPTVNRVIVFFHSRLLNLFANGSPPLNSPRVAFRMASQGLIYDTNVDSLQDECSSRSFLVFVSALRAKHTHSEDAYRELRVLEMQSQRVLHSRIQTTERADDAILYSVVAHFGAAVMLQEYQQAIGHGEYLRNLLLARVSNDVPVPLGLLKQAIWFDTHLAIARFQPGLLGGEDWIPRLLQPIEQRIAVCLDELPTELTTSVDPIISSEPLRGAMIRLRQAFAFAVSPSQRVVEQGVSGVLFAVFNSSISRLHILNRCISAQMRPHQSGVHIDDIERLHCCLEAMVSTALIYLLDRSSMYTCCFARYLQKNAMLMSVLQLRISDTLQCVAELGAEAKGYQNACLFALFVELQGQLWMASTDGSRFNGRNEQEFTTMARSMGLSTWNDVKGICSGFFLSAVVEPKGEDWVDELLSRDVERPGILRGME